MLIDKPRDAVPEMPRVKIDEKATAIAAQSQLRQQLGFIIINDTPDRLQLDNDSIFHELINPVALLQHNTFVGDRHINLESDTQ